MISHIYSLDLESTELGVDPTSYTFYKAFKDLDGYLMITSIIN